MNVYEEEIAGREFDWYAVDNEGNYGLFSTAGEGSIPTAILENSQAHDDISDYLEAPHWVLKRFGPTMP